MTSRIARFWLSVDQPVRPSQVSEARPGHPAKLHYQACDQNACLPPKTITVPIDVLGSSERGFAYPASSLDLQAAMALSRYLSSFWRLSGQRLLRRTSASYSCESPNSSAASIINSSAESALNSSNTIATMSGSFHLATPTIASARVSRRHRLLAPKVPCESQEHLC